VGLPAINRTSFQPVISTGVSRTATTTKDDQSIETGASSERHKNRREVPQLKVMDDVQGCSSTFHVELY